jgi:hypothetical protein
MGPAFYSPWSLTLLSLKNKKKKKKKKKKRRKGKVVKNGLGHFKVKKPEL